MMRDVMESAGLTIYAEIGLVILFFVFLLIIVRTLTRKREYYETVARIPLEDESDGKNSTEPAEG